MEMKKIKINNVRDAEGRQYRENLQSSTVMVRNKAKKTYKLMASRISECTVYIPFIWLYKPNNSTNTIIFMVIHLRALNIARLQWIN